MTKETTDDDGKRDLKPSGCWVCSGMGYRGMDRCNICGCTGSVFRVEQKTFPNTRKGYIAACEAAGIEPTLDDEDES